MHSNVVLIYVA